MTPAATDEPLGMGAAPGTEETEATGQGAAIVSRRETLVGMAAGALFAAGARSARATAQPVTLTFAVAAVSEETTFE